MVYTRSGPKNADWHEKQKKNKKHFFVLFIFMLVMKPSLLEDRKLKLDYLEF